MPILCWGRWATWPGVFVTFGPSIHPGTQLDLWCLEAPPQGFRKSGRPRQIEVRGFSNFQPVRQLCKGFSGITGEAQVWLH